jgi:hypothetical protein
MGFTTSFTVAFRPEDLWWEYLLAKQPLGTDAGTTQELDGAAQSLFQGENSSSHSVARRTVYLADGSALVYHVIDCQAPDRLTLELQEGAEAAQVRGEKGVPPRIAFEFASIWDAEGVCAGTATTIQYAVRAASKGSRFLGRSADDAAQDEAFAAKFAGMDARWTVDMKARGYEELQSSVSLRVEATGEADENADVSTSQAAAPPQASERAPMRAVQQQVRRPFGVWPASPRKAKAAAAPVEPQRDLELGGGAMQYV